MATSHLSEFQSTWMCFFFHPKTGMSKFPRFSESVNSRLQRERSLRSGSEDEAVGQPHLRVVE